MVPLELSGEGAYLVICRGDELFASGLVLITPLEIIVQEDNVSGTVRVNLINTVKKTIVRNVHVKVVGSSSNEFISGETDLRGVFVADNVAGKVTVIARDKKNLYAFYRGETWLGSPRTTTNYNEVDEYQQNQMPVQQMPNQQKLEKKSYDFRSNIETFNKSMQESNKQKLYKQMRRSEQGVQVDLTK